ncbi:hypothetical protein JZU68_08635, partial [bacterium]|nr:hypothetical protein [bacterium]
FKNVGKRGSPKLTGMGGVKVDWKGADIPKPKWNWWNPGIDELATQWRTTPCAIDWNKDGDFADSGETYSLGSIQNTANGSTNLSPLSITIPPNALAGNTRMRISAKWNFAPASCETGFDGEVEDYSINVVIPVITTGIIAGSPFTA